MLKKGAILISGLFLVSCAGVKPHITDYPRVTAMHFAMSCKKHNKEKDEMLIWQYDSKSWKLYCHKVDNCNYKIDYYLFDPSSKKESYLKSENFNACKMLGE